MDNYVNLSCAVLYMYAIPLWVCCSYEYLVFGETRAKHPDRLSSSLASTGVVPPPSGTASPASGVAPKLPIPPQTSLQVATLTTKDATTSTSHQSQSQESALGRRTFNQVFQTYPCWMEQRYKHCLPTSLEKWVSWCSEQ